MSLIPKLLILYVFVHTQLAYAVTADRITSGYLINFAKFTEWQDDIETVTFCTKSTVIYREIVKLGKIAGTEALNTIDPLRCQVVFLYDEGERLHDTMQNLRHRPIITVSFDPNFFEQGGIIRLIVLGNNIKFEISPENAALSGLKFSSKLLSLAENLRVK